MTDEKVKRTRRPKVVIPDYGEVVKSIMALTFEEKIDVLKELKAEVTAEATRRKEAAEHAAKITEGL